MKSKKRRGDEDFISNNPMKTLITLGLLTLLSACGGGIPLIPLI
jgi:hypothetical protein